MLQGIAESVASGSKRAASREEDSVASGSKRAASRGEAAATAQKAKRVRVSRACDQCRAGREKCDGAQPSCQTCDAQRRSCTYHEQPKKRGIQPNYIRTLELTLAWIFASFPESEKHISTLLPNADHRAHQLIAWKDAVPAEALHTSWRHGIVCRQIDQLLSGADIELPRPTPGVEVEAEAEVEVNVEVAAAAEGVESREAHRHADAQASYQSPPLSAPSDTGVVPQDTVDSVAGAVNAMSPMHDANVSRLLVVSASPWHPHQCICYPFRDIR
jgi:hypothetical protein